MEFKDYYKTLGVERTASQGDIQKAYRKLARKYHPDVNKQAGSEEAFKEVGEAHSVLGDPEKRAKYDQYGVAWKQAEENPGFASPFDQFNGADGFGSFYDVLEHLFGSAGSVRMGQSAGFSGPFTGFGQFSGRGPDHEAKLSLTLEQAAAGGERKITIPGPDGPTTVKVVIPAGVRDGQQMRLSGQGGGGVAGPGDLYLTLQVLPHPRWTIDGLDLHTALSIPAWKAALGGTVMLDTLTGKVRASIPAGTSSGTEIRLKGQGYPSRDGAGDLYVEVQVAFPKKLTEKERTIYEALREIDTKRESHGSE